MSNYNWPMTFGELCIAEAERLILLGVIDQRPDMNSRRGDRLSEVVTSYYYGRHFPVNLPAYVKNTVTIHGETRINGKEIILTIRPSDIMALRRAMYHRERGKP